MKTSITKERLENTKIIRQYGINDLVNYLKKIKKNIKVFEEAIGKEKLEMKRVQGMIDVLESDIKEAERIKKKLSRR